MMPWCPACQLWAPGCHDQAQHAAGWFVPDAQNPQPKPRSVVGSTFKVLFTVFILVPFLLVVGCSLLAGVGGLIGS